MRLVRNVDIIKVMKAAGFDWLFLDLEHGVMSIETAAEICVAAQDSGIAPIVRVPYGELAMATRLLDGGALGIVIPHVDTAGGGGGGGGFFFSTSWLGPHLRNRPRTFAWCVRAALVSIGRSLPASRSFMPLPI